MTELSTCSNENPWLVMREKLGDISVMDHLFNRLDGAYPGRWKANFPNEQAIQNWRDSWAEGFSEDGITLQEVAAGIKACRKMFAWPPSQAEFTKACRPVADASISYYEAVAGLEARGKGEMGTWSHPSVFWAATLMSRDLMTQTYSQVKDRWAAILKAQCERTEWAEIQPPRVALPAPGDAKLSAEAAGQMLRDLEAAGITKQSSDKFDHNHWAKKIINRIANGDKTIGLIQAKFAREALETPLEIAP